jgi:Uncharacterized protein conserved in bacteria
MKVELITKESFSVIGKLGQGLSSKGVMWIPPLWQAADNNFSEIRNLVKTDSQGNIIGAWGAMSDINDNFERWKDQGKYLAGYEVMDDAVPPANWIKWTIPAYKYAVAKCTQGTYNYVFSYMIKEYIPSNQYDIVGAVHEFYDPKGTKGELYLYFPIEKL